MNAEYASPDLRSNRSVDHTPFFRNAALSNAKPNVYETGIVKRARSLTLQHRVQGQPWRIACRAGDPGAQGTEQMPVQGVRS